MKDLYKTLEVDFNVSVEEIKTSYRKLSLKYHPDRQLGKSEEEVKQAEEKFKEINNAYEILGDPENRKKYDDDNLNSYRSPSGNLLVIC